MKMNKQSILLISSGVLVCITLIGFALRGDSELKSLQIQIASNDGNMFITEKEVTELMRGEENSLSLPVSKWDMSELEHRIETNPFVKDAQVYRDVKGNVLVKVAQRRPIARIYHREEKDKYIDEYGDLLPTAASYTARVPIVEIKGLKWEKNLHETEYGANLHQLLQYIEQDEFWRAQIAHIYVQRDGEIEMIPQVTRQKILFGTPEDIDKKFERLKIFYTKILPVKGWNTYTTVNLKFNDQIICE
jgi:cell division protein FtsQ